MKSPKMLGLLNLLINYKDPGRFYWVPFAKWEGFTEYANKFGVDEEYTIIPTPIAYKDNSGNLNVKGNSSTQVPIFHHSNDGLLTMLLNGEVVDKNGNILKMYQDLQESISHQSERYFTPQRVSQLTVINNHLGCHARDILEEPVGKGKYTRSLVRFMGN